MKSDRAINSTGGPFGDRAAVAVVGESLADVAREALKIARVESQSRPVLLVDLLGQGSALDEMFPDDDLHGVSDAARYGVSLGKVARPVPNADSLFVVSGGTESPQADDVMADLRLASAAEERPAGILRLGLAHAADGDRRAAGATGHLRLLTDHPAADPTGADVAHAATKTRTMNARFRKSG